jgi:hypothetical protein
MSQKFTTVVIQCKPLVRNYLENNFGRPVHIPEQHILKKLACAQLFKQNTRNVRVPEYTESLDLIIGYRNFKFDGYNMNPANIQNFNNAVDNFIKNQYRSNLDALLISQECQTNWKKRFEDLLRFTKQNTAHNDEAVKKIRQLRNELEEHEISIQKAIETVVYDFLHLDFDVLPFETIKKDYFRYRRKKIGTQMSSHIN